MGEGSEQSIRDEIAHLESRLADAKARLSNSPGKLIQSNGPLTATPHHYLLLLSDSALPLGSFAFSSGLESYLAHTKSTPTPSNTFTTFLHLSLSSYATTTLPFVLHSHRTPLNLLTYDDLLDASIICTVARRASIAQGRALLSIWDRSFKTSVPSNADAEMKEILELLNSYSTLLRSSSNATANSPTDLPPTSAHLAPLFGVISKVLGLSLSQTAYVFMLSHTKALLSAAVRASVFGPYQAQKVLASEEVQEGIRRVIDRVWEWEVEDAGQGVPVMDLWVGRHELLYSRIFNS